MNLATIFALLAAATAAVANPIEVSLDDRDVAEVTIDNRAADPELDERVHAPPEARALCSGKLIEGPIKLFKGKAVLWVFYSSKNKGTNCAYVDNTSGGRTDLGILIYDTSDLSHWGGHNYDRGNYAQYAGPVWETGLAKHCFQVRIDMPKYDMSGWDSPKKWHCGT